MRKSTHLTNHGMTDDHRNRIEFVKITLPPGKKLQFVYLSEKL